MTEYSLHTLKVGRASRSATRNLRERAIAFLLFLAALSSVGTTVAILAILVYESLSFFKEVPISKFLTDTEWSPLFAEPRYGILPLLSGTLVTTAVALSVAIPIGTISAIYLSEFAPHRVREILKPCLELLVGIPTVVYGYFAFLTVTPWLQILLPDLPSSNMLGAGIVMGIMIIPYVSSVSEDAMRAVPVYLREGSYAMGATRLQTALKIVFPAAISGVIAAYILGISRALGETMIVAIAAGLQPILTFNPMDEAATITAYIVSVSLGDLPHGTLEYQTIFAAGLSLILMTLFFNVLGYFFIRKYREIY